LAFAGIGGGGVVSGRTVGFPACKPAVADALVFIFIFIF